MNQDNNNQITNSSNPIEEGINLNYFKKVIENSGLSEKFPNLNNKWKNDTVKPIKTATDEEKIAAYDKLNIKDLPEDWELKLARIKRIEGDLEDYEQKKVELKGWTDTFTDKKPEQIQEEIKQLEEKNSQITEELNSWKEKHNSIESDLKTWQQEFPNQTSQQVQQIITERENSLSEWIQAFGTRELKEVLEELEVLKKRPDISISEDQFWDDYAERKTIEQNKLDSEELTRQKEKVKEVQERNIKLRQAIDRYLKNERTRRYVLSKPVLTIKQANEAIAELLTETEQEWDYYLTSITTDQNFPFDLSLWEQEELERAKKVLDNIKEARTTLDYQTLFERWNRGEKKYNKKNDFDGRLYLLSEWLKVKDFEAPKEEVKIV